MAKSRSAVNMTQGWLRSLSPPETGRAEFHDAQVRGLGLRVSSTGHKAWFVHYRVKGDPKLRRLTLGTYPALGLADARALAQTELAKIVRGGDPAGERSAAREALTVEGLANLYMELHSKPKKRSWKRDAQILRAIVLPEWGKRKAHEVSRTDVRQLLDKVVARNTPIQANRTLAMVRGMYNWGMDNDHVNDNPCFRVKAPAPESECEHVLSTEEIRLVWPVFEAQSQVLGSIFKLLLLTGQRVGEVCRMRWKDLDLEESWWTIPAEFSKNKKSHRVPLAPMALSIIEAMPRISEWTFPSPKAGQPLLNVYKAAGRIKQESGVWFTPHSFRRTVGTRMGSLGTPRLVIAKVLNHTDKGVTRIYDRHTYDPEKRPALEQWEQKLMEIVNIGTGQDGQKQTI